MIEPSAIPDRRKLNVHSKTKGEEKVITAYSLSVPADVMKAWIERYGKVEEVDIYRQDGGIFICPRGRRSES